MTDHDRICQPWAADIAAAIAGPTYPFVAVANGANTALTNSITTAQSIVAAAVDTLAVLASTSYRFRSRIALNTGATTHTTSFGIALTTATLTSIHYTAWSTSSAANTLATPQMMRVGTATATAVTATSTAVATEIILDGIIRVNAAGSITPQVTFSAGPTGTCEVEADSYFELWPIGTDAVVAFPTQAWS